MRFRSQKIIEARGVCGDLVDAGVFRTAATARGQDDRASGFGEEQGYGRADLPGSDDQVRAL
jgi:hypothetical protein